MVLDAIVHQVNWNSLLVREVGSNQEILVNFPNSRRFSRGDCVRIVHTGQMTMSIPPQVSAISVQVINCRPSINPPSSRPSEMTVNILQTRRNELLVRDIRSNRQMIVRTPYVHHFCRGQRIIVTYDTIRMNNPPDVDAIDIRLIC